MCDSWEEAKKKADRIFDKDGFLECTSGTIDPNCNEYNKYVTTKGFPNRHRVRGVGWFINPSEIGKGDTFQEDAETWRCIFNEFTQDCNYRDYKHRFAAVLVDQDEGGSK